MVLIKSKKFGEVEIDKDKIITFPAGLSGFHGRDRYTLLSREENRPFCWLQSVEDPDLALIMIDPFLFKPDYELNLDEVAEKMEWECTDNKNMTVYVVVTVTEGKPQKINANLMGPIVVNTEKNEAVQVVLQNSNYSFSHNVLGG